QFKEAAQQGAKAAGFAFSISSSKLSCVEKDGCVPFVTLQCVMGGNYRNNNKISEETRKRTKFTKRQNCSVSLRAVLNENIGVWIVTSYKSQHNYELLPSSQVHYFYQHQILNIEQKELVHTMIRNVINEHDQIKNALNEAICPEVLIVDATYKTNLYKLPLVNAVGVSNIGNTKALNTYQIAIAWVANEQKHIYTWFLNTLNETIYNVFSCFPEVAYSGKMSEVEKAFDKIKQTIAKSRNPIYIQNYLEEWKKDAE
ncbi:39649_t:CDS:2, partial [Gigaspora margarita]